MTIPKRHSLPQGNTFDLNGAQERTRTSTPLRELAPEASASANSATWAMRAPQNGPQPYCRAADGLSTKHTRAGEFLTRSNAGPKVIFGKSGVKGGAIRW